MIVGVLQQSLVNRFPKFAYWVYGSEAVASGVVAVVLLGAGVVFFAGAALYSLNSVLQLVGYEKKRREKAVEAEWAPPRWARLTAYSFSALLAITGLWLVLAGLGLFVTAIGLAVTAAALAELYTVWKTGWLGFAA